MLWALMVRDNLCITTYYLEGSKKDLFALIGYMYSVFEINIERISYWRITALDITLERRIAKSEDYYQLYYKGKEVYNYGEKR